MKNYILAFIVLGCISAQAEELIKCKPTGVDSGSTTELDILFDRGADFGHPRHIQASLLSEEKETVLTFSNLQEETDGFFLIDKKTKHNYYVSRHSPRSAITILCTEPKALGMMLPCSEDTEFKCKKTSQIERRSVE